MFIKRVVLVSSGSPACVLREPRVHWNNKPLADCSDSGFCGLIECGGVFRQTLTYDSLPGKFPSSSPRRSVWGGLLNQGNVGNMSVIFVCVFVLCASFFFSPKGHIWSVVLVLICSCQNGRQTCQNAVAILGDWEDPRVSRWEKESNRVLLHLGKGGFCLWPSESVFVVARMAGRGDGMLWGLWGTGKMFWFPTGRKNLIGFITIWTKGDSAPSHLSLFFFCGGCWAVVFYCLSVLCFVFGLGLMTV